MVSFLPLLFAALAGIALVLMLAALWQSVRGVLSHDASHAPALHPQSAAREALLHEKQELLQAIRDVRFEHDLGKLSPAEFERLDAQYRARAREVLQLLDTQLSPYRERARAMLGEGASASPTQAATVSESHVVAKGTCASCQTSNDADALFCKKCGTRLVAELATEVEAS